MMNLMKYLKQEKQSKYLGIHSIVCLLCGIGTATGTSESTPVSEHLEIAKPIEMKDLADQVGVKQEFITPIIAPVNVSLSIPDPQQKKKPASPVEQPPQAKRPDLVRENSGALADDY